MKILIHKTLFTFLMLFFCCVASSLASLQPRLTALETSSPTVTPTIKVFSRAAKVDSEFLFSGMGFYAPVVVRLNDIVVDASLIDNQNISIKIPKDLTWGTYMFNLTCNGISLEAKLSISVGPNITQLNNAIDYRQNTTLKFSGLTNNNSDCPNLRIVDVNGTEIYYKEAYDNSWNGLYKENKLAQGTYYYFLESVSGAIIQKGFVSIID